MINKIQFLGIMGPLIRYIGKSMDDELVEIYADALRNYEEADLKRAIQHLIETWVSATFPRIQHIKDAVAETSSNPNYATPEDLEGPCDKCNGIGRDYVYVDNGTSTKEVFCTCRKGNELREARRRWVRKNMAEVETQRGYVDRTQGTDMRTPGNQNNPPVKTLTLGSSSLFDE